MSAPAGRATSAVACSPRGDRRPGTPSARRGPPPPRRGAAPCDVPRVRTPRVRSWSAIAICDGIGSISVRSICCRDWRRRWPVIVEEEPVFDDRPPGLDVLPVAEGVTVLRPHRRPSEDLRPRARSSRTTSRWPAAADRSSAGSTRRCSPLTATGSATARSSSTTAWTSWPTSPAPRPGWSRPRRGCSARADVVFTGGRSLYESKQGPATPNVHCFPSAVEFDHFARALDPELPLPRRPGRAAPADLRLLRRGRRAARLRADRRGWPTRNAARLGRARRPDDQGRPGRACRGGRTCTISARSRTPSCPATSRASTSA